jgi:hypothetical protein
MLIPGRTLFILPLALLACTTPAEDDGSDMDESGETGETGETGDPAEIDCAVDAWDIEQEQAWKISWMAACMVPEIAPIMQGIDADLYANFSCANCHGPDAASIDFAMPAAVVVDFANPDTIDTNYFDPNTFTGPMVDVTTKAVELLGKEPYDQSTMMGFGCFGCHTMP